MQANPTLVPGHVIVTQKTLEPTTRWSLVVYPFTAFAAFWRPVSGLSWWDRVHPRDLTAFATEYPEFNKIPLGNECQSIELRALASPLCRNTYHVVLYAVDYAVDYVPGRHKRTMSSIIRTALTRKPPIQPASVERCLLFSYRFDVSARPVWQFMSSEPAQLYVDGGSVSFARYCLQSSLFPKVIDARAQRERAGGVVMQERPGGVVMPLLFMRDPLETSAHEFALNEASKTP
ncbi:hypothetical protein C8R43DRAFT_958696 [Mycena crocata]|nr:hypothetical protein C8R43DRAFT_958696 [Mycena crocata]